ncbi:MAG: LuxR C-terminal-related transcriptional regulator [Amaricoccus sp.]|uniref:helix-turn-helix transcriptional regulator n=1 Tax=Amaricoccus sp. TaxID=1872485 RepID=UPI0039E32C24
MWGGSAVRRYAVRLDLADADLADALAEGLAVSPVLTAVASDDRPDVTVTDRRAAGAAPPVLRLVDGPLPEDAPVELVLAAAHLMAAGLRVEAGQPRDAPPPHLSPREREVLALLSDGASNKTIARALGITERTAKFHVAAVLARLGARNRSEAVSLGLREGLVAL